MKIFRLIFCIFVFSAVFEISAQEVLSDSEKENSDEDSFLESDFENADLSEDDFGGLDSLFENAEDLSEPVVAEEEAEEKPSIIPFSLPLKFSGSFSGEIGAVFVREDGENDYSGYLDIENYLYMDARADKTLAIHGALKSTMPGTLLELYELYVNYLLLDKIYISAGKKATSWGNIRIFSDANDEKGINDTNAHYTNILYDSRDGISGVVTVPVLTGTITGVALYKGSSTAPKSSDLSFALSLEMIALKTKFNLFARKFPSGSDHQDFALGAEVKRTIFGFDIYAQELSRIQDKSAVKDFFSSSFSDKTAFSSFISTGGIYKWWDSSYPTFGFNVEFQDVYSPHENEDKHNDRFVIECGVGKLGKSHNIKLLAKWQHDMDDSSKRLLRGACSVSGLLPHADWRTGFEWYYGISKINIGTYLKISLGY